MARWRFVFLLIALGTYYNIYNRSMDSYKQQTMMSISGSMMAIKKETGRDVKWSTVCYQDYEEKAALPGNQYQQLNFTKKPEEME